MNDVSVTLVQVGNGIVSTLVIGMASQNPFQTKPQAGQNSIPLDSFERVLRTRRIINAGRTLERGDKTTVKTDKEGNDPFHCI